MSYEAVYISLACTDCTTERLSEKKTATLIAVVPVCNEKTLLYDIATSHTQRPYTQTRQANFNRAVIISPWLIGLKRG